MKDIKWQILEKIANAQKIICLRHTSPDGDAFGSAFGLAQFIKDNFPSKEVFVDGVGVKYLEFLAKPDYVEESAYSDALVIITDTANVERIDSKYWKSAKEIIKIDHHPNITPYGDLQWVDENRIAVSEMIAELVVESKMVISPQTARLIYTGIVTDSNRFMYSQTTSETFKLVSQLLTTGFDLQEIYRNLYEDSWKNVQFKSYLLSQVSITNLGVAYLKITSKMLELYQMEYDIVKPWVNIMSNIKEFKIWVLLIENKKEDYINVSIRSSRYIINEVAQLHHGGGHKLASGAKIYRWDEASSLIESLDEVIKNNILMED